MRRRALALAIAAPIIATCAPFPTGARGCGPLTASEPSPAAPATPLRVIPVDARWRDDDAELCIAGIRVYDGRYQVVGYERGAADPMVVPWHAQSPMLVTDDRGAPHYPSSFAPAPGGVYAIWFEGSAGSNGRAGGDLLQGVRELTFTVHDVPRAVDGPWTFDLPARTGELRAVATAAGRQVEVNDIVVTDRDVAISYVKLGEAAGPGPGVRLPQTVVSGLSDDRGTSYAVASRAERIGTAPFLYARYTPAPPAGARLRFTVERIYERSDRTWSGSLALR